MVAPFPRDSSLLWLALVWAWVGATPEGMAQEVGVETDSHVCGDCHGSHTVRPGVAALVRAGRSELTPQAPGIGDASIRCLQCHGTEGDRRQAGSDRPVLLDGALYLGGGLHDDHRLGWGPVGEGYARSLSVEEPYGDRPGLRVLRPDFDAEGAVECGSCHDPHAAWVVGRQDPRQVETCLVCHDPVILIGGHGTVPCGACHLLHGARSVEHLGRERSPDYLCGACHDGAPVPLNLGIQPLPGPPVHIEPTSTRCSECHGIHGGTLGF